MDKVVIERWIINANDTFQRIDLRFNRLEEKVKAVESRLDVLIKILDARDKVKNER